MRNVSEQVDLFTSEEYQDQLRRRLKEIMRSNRYSISKVSRLLDLATPTVDLFINPQKKKNRLEALLKIEKFIIEMENTKKGS